MNQGVNISIFLSKKFLETVSEAMQKYGFNSCSEFFRTAAKFYLKTCNMESEKQNG